MRNMNVQKIVNSVIRRWTVWITLHYPGAMRDDTLAQLFQYFQYAPYWTQHPVFDTLINTGYIHRTASTRSALSSKKQD